MAAARAMSPAAEAAVDVAHIVRHNTLVSGIRGEGQSDTHCAMAPMHQRRFEANLIHT